MKTREIFSGETDLRDIPVLCRSLFDLTAVLKIKLPQIGFEPGRNIEFDHSINDRYLLMKIERSKIFYIAVILFIPVSETLAFFFQWKCHRAIFGITMKN